MSNLTSSQRSKIKTNNFALPSKAKTSGAKKKSGNYPIPDKNHARSALSLVSRFGTPAEKAKVKSAVKKKFPTVGKKPTSLNKFKSK